MYRKEYIKPEVELVMMSDFMEGEMREGSWGVDGGHTPIVDSGDDEIIIYSKKNNLWDDWED